MIRRISIRPKSASIGSSSTAICKATSPAPGPPSFILPLDDPREGEPRTAYAPHLYSVQMEFSRAFNPATDVTLPNWEANRNRETEAQKDRAPDRPGRNCC
jgi:hypothetical protein